MNDKHTTPEQLTAEAARLEAHAEELRQFAALRRHYRERVSLMLDRWGMQSRDGEDDQQLRDAIVQQMFAARADAARPAEDNVVRDVFGLRPVPAADDEAGPHPF